VIGRCGGVCGCGCARVFAGDLGGPATVSRISDLDEGTKFIFFFDFSPARGWFVPPHCGSARYHHIITSLDGRLDSYRRLTVP